MPSFSREKRVDCDIFGMELRMMDVILVLFLTNLQLLCLLCSSINFSWSLWLLHLAGYRVLCSKMVQLKDGKQKEVE